VAGTSPAGTAATDPATTGSGTPAGPAPADPAAPGASTDPATPAGPGLLIEASLGGLLAATTVDAGATPAGPPSAAVSETLGAS
jgi:hypothetical protein